MTVTNINRLINNGFVFIQINFLKFLTNTMPTKYDYSFNVILIPMKLSFWQVPGTFRGYSAFSEREREEMAVPEGMTASV